MAYDEWQKSYGLDATENAGAKGNAPHWKSNFNPGKCCASANSFHSATVYLVVRVTVER